MKTFSLLCLLFFIPSTCDSKFTFPLKIYTGNFHSSVDRDFRTLEKNESSSTNELSLATVPSGKVNFLQMVNNLQGDSGRGYYIEMLLGTPSQTLNILVDTGSSNFAVAGAPHPYITHFNSKLSNSYHSSGMDVSVRYVQGNWVGKLGTDIVTIPKGPNGTITINVATILQSEKFFLPRVNWQGIMGLAYKTLAMPDSSVEPFFDSVVRQTGIPDMFSLQMCGAGLSASSTWDPLGGGLVMGGIEPTLYKGSIWYTPIKEEWYYQVEVLKIEVGGQNLNFDCQEYNTDKAIVDSGTTLLRLPHNVFNAVVDAIIATSLIQQVSSDFWTGTTVACWTKGETQWSIFPKISICLRGMNNSQSFCITIMPQLYVQLVPGLENSLECYRFRIAPSTTGLVIGATVMEGFYVTFDRAQKKVGFAVSTCAEKSGSPLSEIGGPFLASDVSSNCAKTPAIEEPVPSIASYVLMGLCTVSLIILVILLLVLCRHGNDAE